jgi:hypothetical protein
MAIHDLDPSKRRFERHKRPVVMIVIDRKSNETDEVFTEKVDKAIGDFFRAWDNTHVIDEPRYMLSDNGTERLLLFATCKAYALEKIGFAAEVGAHQQFVGQAKFQKLQQDAAGQVAVAPPGSQVHPDGPRPLRGAFGATERR